LSPNEPHWRKTQGCVACFPVTYGLFLIYFEKQ